MVLSLYLRNIYKRRYICNLTILPSDSVLLVHSKYVDVYMNGGVYYEVSYTHGYEHVMRIIL